MEKIGLYLLKRSCYGTHSDKSFNCSSFVKVLGERKSLIFNKLGKMIENIHSPKQNSCALELI